jgi:hypothetical protein
MFAVVLQAQAAYISAKENRQWQGRRREALAKDMRHET